MMESSRQNSSGHKDAQQINESVGEYGQESQSPASFVGTFESIEALIDGKLQKLVASKDLVEAEAKLSLSAILLSLAISLVLVVIATIIWALLNTALGFAILKLSGSYALAILLLLVVNTIIGGWLFTQLKETWSNVGFGSFVSALKE